jgi:hypothetical protein
MLLGAVWWKNVISYLRDEDPGGRELLSGTSDTIKLMVFAVDAELVHLLVDVDIVIHND